MECDAEPGTAGRTMVSRSLDGEELSVVREASVTVGPCPLLRTSQTSRAQYPHQVANAEDSSPLMIGAMWWLSSVATIGVYLEN